MKLVWTQKKPTVEGWYWMRSNRCSKRGPETHIVFVREHCGRMCIVNWEIPNGAEWSGPIPGPEYASE